MVIYRLSEWRIMDNVRLAGNEALGAEVEYCGFHSLGLKGEKGKRHGQDACSGEARLGNECKRASDSVS